MAEELQRIEVNASEVEVARGRLDYVRGLIARRRQACSGGDQGAEPLFEVHVYGDPAPLLNDEACRAVLESVAQHAGACNLAVTFHHDVEEISAALAPRSRSLTMAFVAGVHVKHGAAPGSVPPDRWSVVPASDLEGELYSRSLSDEVWAALLLSDAGTLIRIFTAIGVASVQSDAAGATARRLLSDALRRAADCVLPGAGGMVGVMFCPLCLGSPAVRVDEMPSHLLVRHAAGAMEGALGAEAVK